MIYKIKIKNSHNKPTNKFDYFIILKYNYKKINLIIIKDPK